MELDPIRGREQSGTRPVLVISHDVFNERSGTIIGFAITSQPQRVGFPLALELPKGTLPKPSWIKMGQVRTLSVERVGKRIGHVAPEILTQAIEGLNEIVGY